MSVYTGYGLLEVFFFFIKLWALISCLRTDGWAFQEAGHSKFVWTILLILSFFLPCIGALAALWYLFSVSTQVKRVAQLGRRPGFPT